MLKTKILVIGPLNTPFKSGVTNALNTTIHILKEKNFIIKLSTAKKVSTRNVRKFQIKRIFAFLILLKNFIKNIRKANLIYYIASLSYLGFIRDSIIIIISKLYNKKIYVHVHGGNFKKNLLNNFILSSVIINLYKLVDRVFILSYKFRKDFYFLNKSNISVLPNTIPLNLNNTFIKKKKSKYSKKIKILFLSNLIPSKGYFDLLKTCKLLKDKNIDFECVFAGKFLSVYSKDNTVKLENEFQIFLNENRLSSNVKLIKSLSLKKKISLLKNSNIFILPTKYPGEGLPISLIEAAFYGLPIISTKFSGISDIVKNGKNGYLIEKTDPKLIYLKIFSVFKNKKIYENMSRYSHYVYSKKFSFNKIKSITEKCFEIRK